MRRLPDFEAWAIFATVAKEGSFAKAAEALGLAQATVSKAIKRLEQQSKTMLFHRTSRQLSLTESGYAVLDNAQELVQLGAAMEATIIEQAKSLRGLIRMSAPMSYGLASLASLLPDFLHQNPDVEMSVQFNDQQVDLVAEGFDVALRIANLVDSSLLARRVRAVQLLVVGAPSYFATQGLPQHPADLAQHQALLYAYDKHGSNWRFYHASAGEFTQPLPKSNLKVNNADALLPALKKGLGLALQPDFMVAEALQQGELIQVLPDWQIAPLGLYLVTPPGRKRPARVEALIEYLVQNLS